MILGITGGTGCGKTTLLKLIQERGGLVLDCDAIYHELLEADSAMLGAIRSRFPAAFEGNQFNRKALGAIVFSDPDALLALNEITHSAVRREVERRLAQWQGHAAIDAIALIESGLDKLCDATVAVTAPVEARVTRLMARDNIPESYARSRIAAQKSDEWFREHCGDTLVNDSDCATFTTKCLAFLDSKGII